MSPKVKGTPAMDMAALAVLGLDPKEIEGKVVERIADRVLQGWGTDEEGEYVCDAQFKRKLENRIQEQIEATISLLADKYVLPNVNSYVENLTLQQTNKWGEATGKSMTFIEYLVERCDAYMREEVNYEGKPRGNDSYSWTGRSTRIAFMVDKHLHWSIEQAMKKAFENGNAMIVGGLKKAMEMSLADITNSLKITTETKTR